MFRINKQTLEQIPLGMFYIVEDVVFLKLLLLQHTQ